MNAPVIVAPAHKAEQRLRSLCNDRRLKLLQEFARIEIALAAKDTGTFGKMLQGWIGEDPERQSFKSLSDARNLVAHAYVEIVDTEFGKIAVWRMAKGKNNLNACTMDDKALEKWFDDIQKKTKRLIKELS